VGDSGRRVARTLPLALPWEETTSQPSERCGSHWLPCQPVISRYPATELPSNTSTGLSDDAFVPRIARSWSSPLGSTDDDELVIVSRKARERGMAEGTGAHLALVVSRFCSCYRMGEEGRVGGGGE